LPECVAEFLLRRIEEAGDIVQVSAVRVERGRPVG
jgi:hypothetical protein